MAPRGEYAATFLTFIALLLEIFVLVSGSGDLPVLRDLYFAQVNLNGKFTRLGLWYEDSNIILSLCKINIDQ